jgi:hypothetical protein
MDSEDEATDISLRISPPQTQFVPQEGDEEKLWKVIEITAETKKNYKVRWEGIDPATNKPWAQSWVPKHDCTDDLVLAWKLSKARKKSEAQRKKGVHGVLSWSRTFAYSFHNSQSGKAERTRVCGGQNINRYEIQRRSHINFDHPTTSARFPHRYIRTRKLTTVSPPISSILNVSKSKNQTQTL